MMNTKTLRVVVLVALALFAFSSVSFASPPDKGQDKKEGKEDKQHTKAMKHGEKRSGDHGKRGDEGADQAKKEK